MTAAPWPARSLRVSPTLNTVIMSRMHAGCQNAGMMLAAEQPEYIV
jgi:hypothetical protein